MKLKKTRLHSFEKSLSILISIMLIVQFVTPIKVAKAKDVSSVKLIKEVTITDYDGKPLGENIPKNSNVKVNYNFEIPNDASIMPGDTYIIKIPQEIYAEGTDFKVDLETIDGGSIGEFRLGENGIGMITFSDYASTHSNVSCDFSFKTRFDQEKIQNEEKTKILFDIGWKTEAIEVKFHQDEEIPKNVNINKYASKYDSSKAEIEWTINVECGDKKLKNVSVVDTIGYGQEFIKNSLKVDGIDANPKDYKVDGNVIAYNFPEEITGTRQITLRTKLTDLFFNSDIAQAENKAELKVDKNIIKEVIAKQQVNKEWIKKYGSLDTQNNIITWTITLNNRGKVINNVLMEDLIPDKTEYIEGSLKVDDQSMQQYIRIEKDSSGRNKVVFQDVLNKNLVIQFKTKVLNSEILNHQASGSITNVATIRGEGIPNGTKDEATVQVNEELINKYGEYDYSKNEVNWKIWVNKSELHLKGVKVIDDVPVDQDYVDNSFKIEGDDSVLGEMKYIPSEIGDVTKSGTIIYDFGDKSIDKTYIITFKTKLNDFTPNKWWNGKTITNTAKLTADNVKEIESTAKVDVILNFIEKKGEYNIGEDTIKWSIVINRNKINLKDGIIRDKLPKGLDLDIATIKLNKMNLSNGFWGEATEGEEVKVDKSDFTYNRDTGEFVFKIHNIGPEVYRLQFITRITNSRLGSVSNTASFDAIEERITSVSKTEVKDIFFIDGYAIGRGEVGAVRIKKVDGEDTDKALQGAKFKIYDKFGYQVGNEVYTDKNGIAEFNRIRFDVPYTIEEVQAPEGYKLSDNPKENRREIIIDGKKDILFFNDSNIKNKVEEIKEKTWQIIWKNKIDKIKGNVDLLKVDENGDKLTGAEFKVYKDINKNGIYDEDIDTFEGNMIESSEDNSLYELNDLEYGKYLLKETKAPEGYVLDKNYHAFEIKEEGKTVTVENEKGRDFVNYQAVGSVELTKVDEDNIYNRLSGAIFRVYKDVDNNGKFNENIDKLVGDMAENYGVYFMDKLPIGNYFIKEVKAPKGYILDTNYHSFKISENGQNINVEKEAGKNFTNKKIKGNVDLLKVNESGNKLTGAKFEVYRDVNENGIYDKGIDIFEGDMIESNENNSLYELNDLEYGKYLLKEIKSPEGYVIDKKYYAFRITEDGKTVTVENKAGKNFINNRITGNVNLLKVDENGDRLTGAEFKVYKDVNNNGIYDKDEDTFQGNMIESSKDNSIYELNDLEYGKYLLKETKAPEGYVIDKKYYTFEIAEAGKNVTIENELEGNFVNKKIEGNVDLLKVDENGDRLTGAEFKVYRDVDEDGRYDKEIDTFQGNMIENDKDNSLYELNDLKYGKYLVKEAKAPKGYILDENYYAFEINEDGRTVTVENEVGRSFVNYQAIGSVNLVKVDADYPENRLSGAIFNVYKDCNSNGTFDKDIDELVGNMNDNDGVYSMNTLSVGNYFVKEVKAPEGYVLDDNYHAFEIAENGQTVEVETEEGKNFINNRIKGNVNLLKVDETGNRLTGAKFKVYNDVNKNGVYDEGIDTFKGNMIENSENNSLYELNNLEYGKYFLKETKAPEGYVIDNSYHSFEIAEDGQTVEVETEEGKNFINNRIKGNVELLKVDENGDKLTGAEFKIYKDVDENGIYDEYVDEFEGNMIENSENNSLYELNDLEYGKYFLKETKAPEGYVLDTSYHSFEITKNEETVNVETEVGSNFINNRIKGNVELLKVDENGNRLTGAKFKVYKDINEDGIYDGDIDELQGDMIQSSENNSLYELNDLEYGKYLLRETKAPEGYVLDNNYYSFEITKNEETVNVETEVGKNFVNNRIKGNVELLKVDENGNRLTGAKFKVYKDINEDGKYDGDIDELQGDMIQSSENNSLYELNDLEYGKYLLRETKAPEGYVLDTSYHSFEITKNEETVNIETEAGSNFINNRIKGNVELLKVDENRNRLIGAEFKVYRDVNKNGKYDEALDIFEGNMIENSEDNSLYELTNLEYGKYLVKEVKAPEGYVLDESYYAFEIIENGKTVEIETEDDKNFVNNRIKGNVDLLKVDENGNRLTGAEFKVYKDVNENGKYDGDIDKIQGDMIQSGENNSLYELNDLEYGKYLLKETEAPEGYVLDEDYYPFKITDDGKTVTVESVSGKNFINTRIKGNVNLLKVDESGDKLIGAEFKVYRDVNVNGVYDVGIDTFQGNMIESSKDKSLYELNNLEYGKYLLKESKAPEGYVLDKNYYSFNISENGETVTVENKLDKSFINSRIKGNVELLKVDENGNKLTGSEFKVFKDGNLNGVYDEDIDTFQGNMIENSEDNSLYELNDLEYGKYLLKEEKAPEGYMLDENYYDFGITEDGKTITVETKAGSNFINNRIKGNVELLKVDENGNKLTGAEFKVYRDSNDNGIYDEDLDIFQGDMIQSSEDSSLYELNGLPYGKYLLKEIKVPDGYVLDENYYSFSITKNRETVTVENEVGKNFINNRIKGNVNLLKVDENGNKLTGAELKVYKDVNEDGKYDVDIDELQGDMIQSSKNNALYELNDLEYGKYLLRETKAPEGYVLDENYYSFDISENGETVTVNNEAGKNFINTRIKGNVNLLKVDENGNKLTGAEFKVYKDVNENGAYDEDVDTFGGNMIENSEDKSLYELNDLVYGKYLLKETKAPEGYVIDDIYHSFEIAEDGKTVNVETEVGKNFINTKIKGNVKLLKVDENGNGLTGAKFKVYNDVNKNGVYDEEVDTFKGSMIENYKDKSIQEFNNLEYGKYLVKESSAPEGYVIDDIYHPFEIAEDGKTVEVETEEGKSFINTRIKGNVKLLKSDENGNKLTGAKFKVYKDVNENGSYDKDIDKFQGDMIENSETKSMYELNDIEYGKYLLKETEAPEGYVLDESYHSFQISENGKTVTVETKVGNNFINEIIRGSVELIKVDENDLLKKLPGATFEVYKDMNNNGKYDEKVDSVVGHMADNKGVYKMNNLSYGNYLIREIKAPEGYDLNLEVVVFSIKYSNEVVRIEFKNSKKPTIPQIPIIPQVLGKVQILKVDEYGNRLLGAEFKVYRDNNSNGKYDEGIDTLQGYMIENSTSYYNYQLDNLAIGKYLVKEIKAPEGYILDNNYHAFKISTNGEVVTVETEFGENFVNYHKKPSKQEKPIESTKPRNPISSNKIKNTKLPDIKRKNSLISENTGDYNHLDLIVILMSIMILATIYRVKKEKKDKVI